MIHIYLSCKYGVAMNDFLIMLWSKIGWITAILTLPSDISQVIILDYALRTVDKNGCYVCLFWGKGVSQSLIEGWLGACVTYDQLRIGSCNG